MSQSTLPLGWTLPRLHAGELIFLLEWSAAKSTKFQHFAGWLAKVATEESERRITPGMEPGTISLPLITGAVAADFLLGSFSLTRQPMTEGLAKFVDDLALKVVCDVAGTLEHEEATR